LYQLIHIVHPGFDPKPEKALGADRQSPHGHAVSRFDSMLT
jgi:hypothetical protein